MKVDFLEFLLDQDIRVAIFIMKKVIFRYGILRQNIHQHKVGIEVYIMRILIVKEDMVLLIQKNKDVVFVVLEIPMKVGKMMYQ